MTLTVVESCIGAFFVLLKDQTGSNAVCSSSNHCSFTKYISCDNNGFINIIGDHTDIICINKQWRGEEAAGNDNDILN